jgi:hypothetical protein
MVDGVGRMVNSPLQMTTQCLAWKIDDKRMDSFVSGPKFHLPLRCEQLRVEGEPICAKCLGRRGKERKKEGTYPQKWWGLVTEPIDNIGPQVNKMVFSPWFLEKAKRYSLSQESMARAKKMYATATAGVENVPPVPDVTTVAEAVEVVIPASQETPKKAARKTKEKVPAAEAVAAPAPAPVVPEKKKPGPKSGATKKTIKLKGSTTTGTVDTEPLPQITAVVENAGPVETADTVFIKVRRFEHNGKSYLYDSGKHKLYDPKTFTYSGRWDSAAERIVSEIPDSDCEE